MLSHEMPELYIKKPSNCSTWYGQYGKSWMNTFMETASCRELV